MDTDQNAPYAAALLRIARFTAAAGVAAALLAPDVALADKGEKKDNRGQAKQEKREQRATGAQAPAQAPAKLQR